MSANIFPPLESKSFPLIIVSIQIEDVTTSTSIQISRLRDAKTMIMVPISFPAHIARTP